MVFGLSVPTIAWGENSSWDRGPLGSQAAKLQALYAKDGKALRLAPRLYEQTDASPVAIDPRLLDPSREDCLTVVALGSPNIAFLLLFEDAESEPARRAWPIPSAAGVAEVTRCGARKVLLQQLALKMRSRRGVVETLIVQSNLPPSPVAELLPGRNPGPSIPSPQVGRRPWLGPLRTRLAQSIRRTEEQGGRALPPSGLPADETGRGSTVIHLAAGCHRLQLLAESDPEAPPDLDARLYTLTRGEELAVDEEHSGQVLLEHCVGRPDRVHLDFSGARPRSEVTLLQSTWDLPSGIPVDWGPFSRARLARSLFDDGLPALDEGPHFASLGVRGATRAVFAVDPDGCYQAAIATIRGDAQSLRLSALVGSDRFESSARPGLPGTTVTFCAHGRDAAELEVIVMGSGLAWITGVWAVGTSTGSSE